MTVLKQKLGQKIKELRKTQQLTQEELAEKIGIGVANISYIENGKTFPSVDTLEKICKTLQFEPFDLFNFTICKKSLDMRKEIVQAIDSNSQLLESIYRIVMAMK